MWFPSLAIPCNSSEKVSVLSLMAQVAAQPRIRVCPATERFDLTMQLPAFSPAEDICHAFLAIIKDAQENQVITALPDLCYSYDVQNIAELDTFADICTPHARLATPLLSVDGYSTIE